MILRFLTVVAIALTLGCGSSSVDPEGDTDDLFIDESRDLAEYTIIVLDDQEGDVRIEGDLGVDTNYASDIGLVFLNTDEENEPLGTLTLGLGNFEETPVGWRVVIETAFLSTSNVRVGTAAQLDARLYSLVTGTDPNSFANTLAVQIGSNYISASGKLDMERIDPGGSYEVEVSVQLVALSDGT